MIEVFNIYQNK